MKVSVFVPTYNNACYLPECLDSILAQSFQDFEIIIVDDGSQDGSHELLLEYQSRNPGKIRYYWHPGHVNKGVTIASNLAIQKAKGELIARIDSDDIWHPQTLEKQVSILDSRPDIGLVYSCAQFIDESGNDLPRLEGSDVTRDENPLGLILTSMCVPQNTIMIRRSVLDEVGFYDETLLYSDWDLMVRIFSHHKAAFIDTPLAKYRIHDHNLSKGVDPKIELERIITVFRTLEQKISSIGGTLLENRNQAILDLQLAFHIFCYGDKEEAIAHLHRAFHKDPSLGSDMAFFNSWLNLWKPAFYTIDHNHFGFWVIAHLPLSIPLAVRRELADLQLSHPSTLDFFIRRGIQWGRSQNRSVDLEKIFDDCPEEIQLSKAWKKEVLKKIYPALLFENYNMGDLPKTQYYWKKAVQLDPAWLRNRGVWSIGLKAFLGGRATKSVGG